MIVWLDPPPGTPADVLDDLRRVAAEHRGDDLVKVRAGGHVLTLGERVDARSSALIDELCDLNFVVGIEA